MLFIGVDLGTTATLLLLMDEEGMSQSRLAVLSGLSRNSIYRYINCDYPMRLENAERIARALGADEIVIKVRRDS